MRKEAGGERTDQRVVEEIVRLAEQGLRAPLIERELHKRKRFGGLVPTERTIRNIIKRHVPQDPSAPWQLAKSSGESAALILPVLAAVMAQTDNRVRHVTVNEAEWIVRIATAQPTMAQERPWQVYTYARRYMLAAQRGNTQASADLDRQLAVGAWRGPMEHADAVSAGFVDRMPPTRETIPHMADAINRRLARKADQRRTEDQDND